MPTLVLWDVDHTLIENSGVSKEIYAAAFTLLTGRVSEHPAPTEGRTDPLVMRELFALHGLREPDWAETTAALEEAGRGHLEALHERAHVLPGVRECIAALGRRPDVFQSVLTGNIRANAWVKLSPFGLDKLLDLDVGGYGSDAFDRSELVAVARSRAARKYDVAFEPADTVLIGDTPRDVEAARGSGANILAVASGIHSVEELHDSGAQVVLADLADLGRFMAAFEDLINPGVIPAYPKGSGFER